MNLRDVAHSAWRWPLYSRARAIAAAVVLLAVVVAIPRLGAATPTPPPSTPVAEQADNAALPSSGQAEPSLNPSSPSGAAVSSQPSRSAATTSSGPAEAATRWLQLWCATTPAQAAGDNVRAVSALMTPTAYTAEMRTAPTAQSWTRTRNAGLSTSCEGVRAETPSTAPSGSTTTRWIVLTAQQITLNRAGGLVSSNAITQTRKMILTSGTWLVAERVEAG